MHTTSAKILDIDQTEAPNSFCTNTPSDRLDSTSAMDSDIIQCENQCDVCTYSHFDNIHKASANDSTPIGTEGTLCKFIQSNISDILQCDGADSISETSSNDSLNSENKIDSNPIRPTLVPCAVKGLANDPIRLEVYVTGTVRAPSSVPLCAISNPRSGWNKVHTICTFLRQFSPDILILSEHWGRKKPFQNALALEHYKLKE